MHLLLIGHGYLGKAVAGVFRDGGWEVTACSFGGGDGVEALDVGDAGAVARLAARLRPVDRILHCAATGRGGADAYRHVYVGGCRNLVAAFSGVPVLFVSSSSVYAQVGGEEVSEESEACPERETGRLLLEAERVVLAAGGVAARLSGIYGPGRSVILRKFLTGEAVLEEDGRRYLNQIHRDDAAAALWLLACRARELAGAVFNVSDSAPLSQLECYRGLSDLFGLPLPQVAPRDLDRKRGWTHKRVSNAKLRGLGWEPQHPSFLGAAREIAATL